MHVGEIINKYRKEEKMTLSELSQKSGVALATLSRVENGKMTGTLKSHINICDALGITITDLYKDLPSAKKTVEVKTKEPGPKVSIHDKKSSAIILATNVRDKNMLPILITIAKHGRTGAEEDARGVEKFIYVTEGRIEAAIGEEKYILGSGDTIYFDSSVPHYFKNLGNSEARIISVSCPPAA